METTKNTSIINVLDFHSQAFKLRNQQSWIVKGIKSLMKAWSDATDSDASYHSTSVLITRVMTYAGHAPEQTIKFNLVTGSQELKAKYADPFTGDICEIDWDLNSVWWDSMSTQNLRKVLRQLPQAMAECLESMRAAAAENDTACELLYKLHAAFGIGIGIENEVPNV